MIGVIDSGIGGVTVLRELLKVLPKEEYLYYSDSVNSPYGDKDIEQLKVIVSDAVQYLINKQCKIIVIACNTASTVVDYIRGKHDIPIVAIEPAYKMVYDNDYSEKTLIIATKATIDSQKFKNLYLKYNNHNTSILPCVGLAELIEEGNNQKLDDYLKQKLSKYKGVKCVVLGCTHYPLIKNNIKKVLGDVKFYDGSVGVSKVVKNILTDKNLLNTSSDGKISFIDTNKSLEREKIFFSLLKNLK